MECRARQNGLRLFLAALYGQERGSFVEVAHRWERGGRRGPMHRGRTGVFCPISDLEALAHEIEELGQREHVWVGVVPRRPHPDTGELGGKKENVAAARVLWADCDLQETPDALERLRAFSPPPRMLVSSGGGYHAYWLLREPIDAPDRLREANERLAAAIGADRQSAEAARILRPPGTLNFKSEYGQPRPVELLCFEPEPRCLLQEVVGGLPGLEEGARPLRPKTSPSPARRADPLQRIAPAEYFRRLCGLEPDRGGKVCCPRPAHHDPDPSCHVYETAAEGWYCFGCGHGGDIYELAGELWGLRREGWQFLELRQCLGDLFRAGARSVWREAGHGR
jgi:hypothetical protein